MLLCQRVGRLPRHIITKSILRNYSSEASISKYPIASERNRTNVLLMPIPNQSPLETYILFPLRRILGKLACVALVNNRFKVDDQKSYFPDVFIEGVNQALPIIFNKLSNWNGVDGKEALEELIIPDLLNKLSKIHMDLDTKKLLPNFNINSIKYTDIDDIWFSFGPADVITSTNLPAEVIERKNAVTNRRKFNSKFDLYRQMTLEYVVEPESEANNTIQRGSLQDAMKKGHMISVDLTFISDLEVSFGKESPFAKKDLRVRFESTHYKGTNVDNVVWRLADFDYYLANDRVREMEEFLKNQEQRD